MSRLRFASLLAATTLVAATLLLVADSDAADPVGVIRKSQKAAQLVSPGRVSLKSFAASRNNNVTQEKAQLKPVPVAPVKGYVPASVNSSVIPGRVRISATDVDRGNAKGVVYMQANRDEDNEEEADVTVDPSLEHDANNQQQPEDEGSEGDDSATDDGLDESSSSRQSTPAFYNELFSPVRSVGLSAAAALVNDTHQLSNRPSNDAARLMPLPKRSYQFPKASGAALNQIQIPYHRNPLYFEDIELERCGINQGCLTTMNSATEFVGRSILLPYTMLSEPAASTVPAETHCPRQTTVLGFPGVAGPTSGATANTESFLPSLVRQALVFVAP